MKRYQLRMYLVKARQQLGYSQYRVALEANISHQHYNMIENGKITEGITFYIFAKVVKALCIPLDEAWEEELKYQEAFHQEDYEWKRELMLLNEAFNSKQKVL